MGEVYIVSRGVAGAGIGLANYFGDGSDGALNTSGNVTLTVFNKNGSYDGDMVVKNYSSLTINSGHTLTTDQPCRGLLIYVEGDCTINGTLSMTRRGAAANPTIGGASDGNAVDSNGLRFPFLTVGTDSLDTNETLLNGTGVLSRTAISKHPKLTGNGKVLTVQRLGANGGARTGGGTPISPNNGLNGSVGQSGGGGSGGGYYTQSQAGAGGQGTCFSGGTGGGGSHGGTNSVDGAPYGGQGGRASTSDGGYPVPGGIGNPNGFWSNTTSTYIVNGTDNSAGGTGGLVVLIVGGTLTIGSTGSIRADGFAGPNFSNTNRGGAGASGGGNVIVAYRSISNSGSITANGGARWGWNTQVGGSGGNGSIQTLQIL